MGEYVIRDDYSYSVPSTRTPPFHVGRQLWFYAKTFKTHPAPLEVIPEHEYRFPRDELESEYERTRDMYTDMTMALVGMLSDCRRGHYIFKFDLSFEWMRRLTFFHPNVNRHNSVLWGGFLDSPFQFLSNWKCFQLSMTPQMRNSFNIAASVEFNNSMHPRLRYELFDIAFMFYISTPTGFIVRYVSFFQVSGGMPSTGGVIHHTHAMVLYNYDQHEETERYLRFFLHEDGTMR
jgi:hypothetical protein